jgi:hypothetical protein
MVDGAIGTHPRALGADTLRARDERGADSWRPAARLLHWPGRRRTISFDVFDYMIATADRSVNRALRHLALANARGPGRQLVLQSIATAVCSPW